MTITSDKAGKTESGKDFPPGTKVTYLGHEFGVAVRVRLKDGSEEVVHPYCFKEFR